MEKVGKIIKLVENKVNFEEWLGEIEDEIQKIDREIESLPARRN